jgi:hypothetical protein
LKFDWDRTGTANRCPCRESTERFKGGVVQIYVPAASAAH